MSESYGTIYLLQPREYIETNVYKIGLSHKNDLKRCLSYGKDTKFISIHECKNPRVIENIIKDEFNNKFEKCKGHEYFKGNISEIYKLFNKLVIDYNNKDDCDEASCAYEADNTVNFNNANNINSKQTKIEYSKKKTKYYCNLCNFRTNLKENFRVHNTTKHTKKFYESKDYKCDLCFYSTSLYQNYQTHLETRKHKSKVIEEKKQPNKKNEKKIDILLEKVDKSDLILEELIKQNKIMYENQQFMYHNHKVRFDDQKNSNIVEMTKNAS